MKIRNIYHCFILCCTFIFSGCDHSQPNMDFEISRASLTPFIESEKPDDIAMIYNIDKQNQTLIYKAVKVEESSGNPMRDALNVFFEENNISDYYDQMRLKSISKKDNKTVYSFTGKPKFQSSADSAIFWKALDITIARNSENLDYIVEMKEEDLPK